MGKSETCSVDQHLLLSRAQLSISNPMSRQWPNISRFSPIMDFTTVLYIQVIPHLPHGPSTLVGRQMARESFMEEALPITNAEMVLSHSVFQQGSLVGQYERGLGSLDRPRMVVSRCHDPVADVSLALFQEAWECPVKTESETLEHIGSYAGTLPFVANSHLRPYSYGLLDQQVQQPLSMFNKYPRYSGPSDTAPYVNTFLVVDQPPLPPFWTSRIKLPVSAASPMVILPGPAHTVCLTSNHEAPTIIPPLRISWRLTVAQIPPFAHWHRDTGPGTVLACI